MKAEIDKLNIRLVNVPTSLNNLKTKVYDLDVGILKTVLADLSKIRISDKIVDNELAKRTKFNTLKKKVNKIVKKIPDATTLVPINQYNTDNKI